MPFKLHKNKNEYFCSCPQGLEELLENEISPLGVAHMRKSQRGVHFVGYAEKALELILSSRVASRIFKKLYSFTIRDQKELYEAVSQIKWKGILRPEQNIKIVTTFGSAHQKKVQLFDNTLYASQVIKDGICDYFMNKVGKRPNVDLKHPHIIIHCHMEPTESGHAIDRVQLSLDLTNKPLSDRGYRKPKQLAPLRENLAAALVLMGGWDSTKQDFVDLTCGSGTVTFEALSIALGWSPRFLLIERYLKNQKPWAFLEHIWFTKDKYQQEHWNQLVSKYRVNREHTNIPVAFIINDSNKEAVEATRELIFHAFGQSLADGLGQNTQQLDQLISNRSQDKPSWFFANPPYGRRIELDQENHESIQAAIKIISHSQGDSANKSELGLILPREYFKSFPSEKKASKSFNLYNGAIPVQFKVY
jgi:putative N6-adenine-specific DNA methylase